jgi:hypothetical protein
LRLVLVEHVLVQVLEKVVLALGVDEREQRHAVGEEVLDVLEVRKAEVGLELEQLVAQ